MKSRAAKTGASGKTCNCLEKVQAKLAEERPNVRLQTRMQVDFETGKCRDLPLLAVEKIDSTKRTRLPTIVCSYCPFCGKKKNV